MKDTKNDLADIFSRIQYRSEVIVNDLSVLGQTTQAIDLKKVFSDYLFNKLSLTKNSLMNVTSINEFTEILKVIEDDYQYLFDDINKHVTALKEGEDISDYIFQLKQKNRDISENLLDKIKRLI